MLIKATLKKKKTKNIKTSKLMCQSFIPYPLKTQNRNPSLFKMFFFLISCILGSCAIPQSKNNMSKNPTHNNTNALINESSLYLQQHAHNPVDWLPWSDKAFEKAKKENKLVLISIGYSACHWCHVMEKESFEDTAVAKLMNDNFVCIKVDREERPDVDDVYMLAVQLMTRQGGWPLNCFTLPNGKPIYGGTYFPKSQWVEILNSLSASYKKQPQKVEEYAETLSAAINQNNAIVHIDSSNESVKKINFGEIFIQLESNFDYDNGGHKGAPKFPMPVEWQFMMDYAFYSKDKAAEEHLKLTLQKMTSGAMYDQIGGGFARYSVDEEWKIPHFEKMLYDNAQLISLYSNAYRMFGNSQYLDIAEASAEFLIREMYNPKSGGFYSALDADSEGEEGKFYVFTKEELTNNIPKDLYPLATKWFGLDAYALWEDEKYALCNRKTVDELSQEFNLGKREVKLQQQSIRTALLKHRNKRIRPGLDDKEIAGWNALNCIAFTNLYKASGSNSYLQQVDKSLSFFENYLFKNNKVLRYYKENGRKIDGNLEDYATWALAYLHAAELEKAPERINKAANLVAIINKKFLQDSALFYNSSPLGSSLISNPVELSDNVIMSANSTMAEVLFYLTKSGYYPEYERKFKIMMVHQFGNLQDYPTGYFNWQRLYLKQQNTYNELILNQVSTETQKILHAQYRPDILQLPLDTESEKPIIFAGKFEKNKSLYYLCTNKVCQKPVDNTNALQNLLR